MQKNSWFIIVNPTSGKGYGKSHLPKIEYYFNLYDIPYQLAITQFVHHEKQLVKQAITEGFTKIVCVGGDGTLHHIVNGIMSQTIIKTSHIKLAVIPVGTGNDWVKTYKIPRSIKKAIKLIKQERFILQDVGKIELLTNNKTLFFNNVAGVGFDAFAIEKITKFKFLGKAAYIVGALLSFLSYKPNEVYLKFNQSSLKINVFLLTIGIGKYSGAGMRLTHYKTHKNGLFDLTIVDNISLLKVIFNIYRLFNGTLGVLKEVNYNKTTDISIAFKPTSQMQIQADGELIGEGNCNISIVKNALSILVP